MHTTTTTNPAAPSTSAPGGLERGPLAADDPRFVLATAVATAGPIVAGTTPGQLELSTPCDEFDVRALLGHLVAVLGRVAAVGRGEPVMSTPQIITGVTDDGWSAAWLDAAHGVQAVWQDDRLLDGTYVLPWATKTGPELLLTYAGEVSVHTWDLAAATGQVVAWDEPALATAYDIVLGALPAEHRRLGFEAMRQNFPPQLRDMPPPFDEVVPVPVDAPTIDRLVGWYGRRPNWHR